MNSKTEVLAFLNRLQEDIASGKLTAEHIVVLISNTEEVLGNNVELQASPSPAKVTDTIYMCMSILSALRDHIAKMFPDDPDILSGFKSFLAEIDRHTQSENARRVH